MKTAADERYAMGSHCPGLESGRRTIVWRLSVALAGLLLNLNAAEEPKPMWEWRVEGRIEYGRAEGFLQTPAGGVPGSSSHGRPTLKELGIDDAVFYDMAVFVQRRHYCLYAGYQLIGLDGTGTLSESLISRGVTFPAGTRVQTQTDLDWLRVGAGWKFDFLDHRLAVTPQAEFGLLDFHYELAGGGEAVERSYAHGCFRLGLEAQYRFSPVVSLRAGGGGSVPISNTPQITTITGGIELDPWAGRRRFRPLFFLGAGAQRIEYEDNQALPNHFRVDMEPFFAAGLGLSF